MHGDVPGIDFESEIISSVEDGAVSTPANGKVYTGKIAYTSLGVKSGQTIRVIARELNDRGERHGMFPDAWLKLK